MINEQRSIETQLCFKGKEWIPGSVIILLYSKAQLP